MNNAETAADKTFRTIKAVDALSPNSLAGKAIEYAGINWIEYSDSCAASDAKYGSYLRGLPFIRALI